GQSPDQATLDFFDGQLASGVSRQQVAAEVLNTPLFRAREVQALYLTLLNHGADLGALATWVPALQAGASLQALKASLLGSDEFFARAGGTGAGFVNAL